MDCRVVLRVLLIVSWVIFPVARATAQLHTGGLHGRVVDPGGRPVSGALVTIGGPIAAQSQFTDAAGRFRFLALPPGGYAVKVEREGVTPVGHPNITVRVGRNTEIEITTSPGGHHILGSAESALLDPRVVATGANVRLEQLEKVPFARDPWSILQSTPGVLLDVTNVGGSGTGDQPTVVLHGASRSGNVWSVDGVNLTDMADLGSAPRYFDFGFIDELQTGTGGSDVKQASGGVSVHIVTKRGTNLFQGSSRIFLTTASGIKDDLAPRGGTRYDGGFEFGAEAGGAIVKDRVWFFGGYNRVDSNRDTLIAADSIDRGFGLHSALGKVSFQLPNNSLTAGGYASQFDRAGDGAAPERAPDSLWKVDGQTTFFKVEDSAVLGPAFLLTGMIAFVDSGFDLDPIAGGTTLLDASGLFQGGFQHVTANRTSRQAQIDLTSFAGPHELKFGIGHRKASADSRSEWPGGIITAALPGDPSLRQAILPPDISLSVTTTYTSLYVQDSLRFGNLTANLGLRYDLQQGRNNPSAVLANVRAPLVPATSFEGNEPEWTWGSLVPRLGLTYAIGPDRITLLRASYSRYADQLGMDRILLLNPLAPRMFSGSETFVFLDANANNALDPGEIRGASSIIGFATSDPAFLDPPSDVDPDYKPPMTDELRFGVDRLIGRGALSVHFDWRRRADISDDVPLVGGAGARRPVAVADFGPGPAVSGTDLSGAPFTLETFDLNSPLFYTGGVSVTNGAREQRALNVSLQYDQRFVRGAYVRAWINFGQSEWSVPNSFFIDRNDLLGAEDNDTAPVADQSASPDRRGVFVNANWSYELLGMTRLMGGFEVGGRVYSRQGYPAPLFVTVNAGDATRLVQVGKFEDERTGRIVLVDLRVERALTLMKRDVAVTAGVFNLLNRQVVLQRVGDLTNPFKGSAVEVLSPRAFRIGARVKF